MAVTNKSKLIFNLKKKEEGRGKKGRRGEGRREKGEGRR
jgi:hypothetical protein